MNKLPRLTRLPHRGGYEFHFLPSGQQLIIGPVLGGGWKINVYGPGEAPRSAVGQGIYPSLGSVRAHIAAALTDAHNGYKVRW